MSDLEYQQIFKILLPVSYKYQIVITKDYIEGRAQLSSKREAFVFNDVPNLPLE